MARRVPGSLPAPHHTREESRTADARISFLFKKNSYVRISRSPARSMARHMLQLACFRFLLKAATAALLFPLRLCAVVKLELPSFFLRLRWDLVITWWVKIRGLAYFGPV